MIYKDFILLITFYTIITMILGVVGSLIVRIPAVERLMSKLFDIN